MVDTLLTRPSTPEQERSKKGREKDLYNFWDLLHIGADAYIDEEFTLEQMSLWILTIAKEFEGDALEYIPENHRNQIVGDLFLRALSARSPAIEQKTPNEIKVLAADLVAMAREKDGYVLGDSKEGRSAFEYISKRLGKFGIALKPGTLKKYRQEIRKAK